MRKYKAVCVNDKQKESGLMLIKDELYEVSKFNGNVFFEYIVVKGNFYNGKIKFEAERIMQKETCEKHLKII